MLGPDLSIPTLSSCGVKHLWRVGEDGGRQWLVDEEGGAWQEPSFLPNDNPDEARLLRLKIKPSKAYFESEGPKRRRKEDSSGQ